MLVMPVKKEIKDNTVLVWHVQEHMLLTFSVSSVFLPTTTTATSITTDRQK
jgi:hypothetical protein